MTKESINHSDIDHASRIYEGAVATIIDWMQWNIKVNMNSL
jgi:hypothetical protein